MVKKVYHLAIAAACGFTSLSAGAVTVDFTQSEGGARVVVQTDGLAAFARFDDLWLVFPETEPVNVNMPEALKRRYKVETTETLQVERGSGIRLRFEDLPYQRVERIDGGFVLVEGAAPSEGSAIPSNLNFDKDQASISAGPGQVATLAHSDRTGETYLVVTVAGDSQQNTEATQGQFRFLPTFNGYALVAKDGYPVNVTKGEGENAYTAKVGEQGNLRRLLAIEEANDVWGQISTAIDRMQLENSVQDAPAQPAPPRQAPPAPQEQTSRYVEYWPEYENEAAEGPATFESAMDRLSYTIKLAESVPLPGEEPEQPEAIFQPGRQTMEAIQNADIQQTNLPTALPRATPELREQAMLKGRKEDIDKKLQEIMEKQAKKPKDVLPTATRLFPEIDPESLENFRETEEILLTAIGQAKTRLEKDKARKELALFYILSRRPQEALGVFSNMTRDFSGYVLLEDAKIFQAIAFLQTGNSKDALEILQRNVTPDNHRQLWLARAMETEGKYEGALPLYEKYISLAVRYPKFLWEDLRISQARVLLHRNRMQELQEEMDKMATRYLERGLPPAAKLVLGRAAVLAGDAATAELLLAEVAESDDPYSKYQAKYEFIKFLHERNELGDEQFIELLERLRYSWRGGELEGDILYDLGFMYLEHDDYRHGLDRLKQYTIYFPDSPKLGEVANVMTSTFIKLFQPENIADMDDLEILGLYYDFRELTPPGQEGDDVIAKIGVRLEKLGLYRRAIELFENQLTYRLKDPKDKAHVGYKIARLSLLSGTPAHGLDVLDDTEPGNVKINEKLAFDRAMVRGRLNMALGFYQAAEDAVENLPGRKPSQLLAEIEWRQNNYAEVAKILQPLFDGVPAESLTEDDLGDLQRLAMALDITGQKQALEVLKKDYESVFKQADAEELVNFLTADMADTQLLEMDDDPSWQELVNSLRDHTGLKSDYEEIRNDRIREKRERQLYNRRFRRR